MSFVVRIVQNTSVQFAVRRTAPLPAAARTKVSAPRNLLLVLKGNLLPTNERTNLTSYLSYRAEEIPCSKPEAERESVGEEGAGACPVAAKPKEPSKRPRAKLPSEEDTEDEDGARLRREHLISIASSDSIRKALCDPHLVETLAHIDASSQAEQALDAACEDPGFREFTEKVLNILDPKP